MNDNRDHGRVSIFITILIAAVALLVTGQVVFLAADQSAPPPTPQAAPADMPGDMPMSAAREAATAAAASSANAWAPLGGPTIAGGQVRGLAVHPAISGTLYAALQPVGGGWGTPSVIMGSTDGGASWTAVYSMPTGARVLAVTGTVIYAGSYNRDGSSLGPVLHRSIDGGLNWTTPISFADGIIRELSIHPTLTQTAAAGGGDWLSHTASLYRTNDAGASWTEVFSYTKMDWYPTVNATLIHPTSPMTWLLSHDGEVGGGGGSYIYRSTDGGTNWSEVYTVTGDLVTSLVANPVTPTTIYAATDSNNLHRSADGGVSWTAVVTDGSAGTQIVLEPPNTLYARIQWSWEVRKSTDGGDTWSTVGWANGNVDRLAIDLAPTPPALYAGQGDWNPAGVSKSTDGGASWTGVNNGIETLALPNDIDVDPQNPDNLFAAAGWGGGFRSDDGGDTWTEPSGLAGGVNEFAINSADSSIAYGGLSDCSRGGLLRSTDGGASFVPVYTATHIISDCSGGSAHVYGLAVASTVSSTVYAVGADEVSWQPERAVILRSLDVGLSWSKVFTLSGESGFHLVAIDPSDDDVVLAGGYDCTDGPCIGAVYRTTAGGGNWTLVLTSTTEVSSIIFDSGIDDTVYVADYDYQVFKSSDGGDNWSVVRCPPWGTCSNSGPSGGLMAADPHWSDRIYLSGWNYTAESLDGGQTWSGWSDPLNQDMPAAAFTAFAVDNGSVTQTLYGGHLGVWAYQRETPYRFTAAVTDTLMAAYLGSPDWGDYDNDGDLDILLIGSSSVGRIARVYRNDGGDAFTDISAGLTGVEQGSAAWGDYDNDGDLDILLTGYDYDDHLIAKVYRNDGSNTFVTAVTTDTLTGVAEGAVAWGDYDNDGDLDILLTGYDDNVRHAKVYRNDGSDTFVTAVTTDTLTGVNDGSVAWGDYDNDGDLDILLTGFTNGSDRVAIVYRNDGYDIFTAAVTDTLPGLAGSSSGVWGDYDNDGDLDILLTGHDGSNRISAVYRNDGSDTFTPAVTDTLSAVSNGTAVWGDYDNDGDLDIVLMGSYSDGSIQYITEVYRNDGSDTFVDNGMPLTGFYNGSVAWGDYDGDSDLDILAMGCTNGSCSERATIIYRNNVTTTNTIPAAPTGLSAQTAEDRVELSWSAPPPTSTTPITGLTYNLYVGTAPGMVDGVSPMAFTVTDPLTNGLRLLPAMGNGQLGLTATLTGLPEGTYYWSVQAVDHAYAGSPFAAESTFTITYPFTAVVTDTLTGVENGSVAWGDYDNDGDLDILLTGRPNIGGPIARVYRNDGSDTFTDIGASLTGAQYGGAEWGDYDNDGDLDILIICSSGSYPTKIYRNDGSDTFTDIGAPFPAVEEGSIAWGDYDNDGDLDILLTGCCESDGDFISKVYRNDGSDTFTSIGASLEIVYNSSVAWGDYDNDGDLDILLTGDSFFSSVQVAKVYRNDGSDTFTDIGAPLTGVRFSSVAWGDYDNDGDLDILLTGEYYDGSIVHVSRVYRNDGSDTFTDISAALAGVSNGDVAWGDYDNDGDLDILLTGGSSGGGVAIVYRNDGFDTFVTAVTTNTLTSVDRSSAAWGDYDNDGDLDILLTGGSSDGGVAIVYRNNTTAANTLPAAPSNLSAQPSESEDTVELSWDAPPPTSTTPITGLTYNLYVGTAPGEVDTASPMAFTAPVSAGLRLLPALGNGQHGLTATLAWLAEGTYYWSVQAVDHTFAGSPFAAEGSFTITYSFSDLDIPLTAVSSSSAAWGNYDNDGDLDILLTGFTGSSRVATVYRNDGSNTFVTAVTTDTLRGVSNSSVAWGDYDNDSDLDILLTGSTGGSRVATVYRNEGSDTFVTAVTTDTLTGVYNGSAAWGDYDNDGDLDILLTGYYWDFGEYYVAEVYRNDGSDIFTDIGASLTGVQESSVAWGDYDNDGDLDILLTGYTGSTYVSKVYRNDGSDTFTDISASLTGVSRGSVAWGDYDNDGDLDILLTGYTGSMYVSKVYRNEGSDTFADISASLAGVSFGSVAWGDYDNDGDLDILLTGFGSKVYRNDGSDIFTDMGVALAGVGGVGGDAVAWGDSDGDGDLDILITGYRHREQVNVATVYRNNMLAANTPPAAPSGLNAQVAGDKVELSWSAPSPTATTLITGLTYNLYVGSAPGMVDVVPPMAFTVTDPLTNGLRLLPALGNGQHGLTATLTGLAEGTYYWSVQAVDHTFAGSPFAVEETFTVTYPFTPVVTDTLTGIHHGSVAWGDYDNDGDLDILLTGWDASPITRVYRNDGSDTFTDTGASLTGMYNGAAVWGDYDNDGDLDILITGYSGTYSAKIYRNDGGDTFTDISAPLTGVTGSSAAWGDYDNDGDLDILLTGYSGSTRISRVYRNDGSDTFTDIGASLAGVYLSSAAWGDYDGDGDLDILLSGNDNSSNYIAKIYRNDGSDTFTDIGAPLTGVEHSSVAWGDYDNDGDLDILLTGRYYDGPMKFVSRVYRNDGSDTFVTAVTTDTLTGVEESSAEWGDYDNDGDLDILLSGCTAWGATSCTGFATQVYRNEGSDVFATAVTTDTLTGVDRSSAAWGDYDGDGDLDILLTGRDSDLNLIAKIYRNNTAAANTVPAAPTGLSAGTDDNSVDLSWAAPPPTATTPITGLTYNLYVGTAPGQVDTASPMAFTAPISDGLRLIPALGNAQHGLTATLTGLAEGTYYWSAQAVDHTFAGSPFAVESSFAVTYTFTPVITDPLSGVSSSSAAWGDYDNDSDLDILLTGYDDSEEVSIVYRNDGTDTFATTSVTLVDVEAGDVAWGDYDNDGDLDILLTGYYWNGSSNVIAEVYRNDGSDIFVGISAPLTGVSASSAAWGDYDNDGDLDILLTGRTVGSTYVSKVYRNDGSDTFTDISAALVTVAQGSAAWGDYDNDGDLDILLTGWDGGGRQAVVYRNDGLDTFTNIGASLTTVDVSSAVWGDYDNDGDLDILLTGCVVSAGPCTSRTAKVYRNDGFDTFTDIAAPLTAVAQSSVAWGDYDNDGDLDILLTGEAASGQVSRVYRNDGSDTFTDINVPLTGVSSGSVAWGDYDDDGDLDMLLTGFTDGSERVSIVYRNNTTGTNSVPSAPSGLSASTEEDAVALSWSAPPPTATTPITGLTYNLYVGTAPGQVDVAPPMAFTAPISDGLRLLPALGNAQHGLTATLTGLAEGTYYWSAQAVDHTFAGSPFAVESSFTITYAFTPVITDTLPGLFASSVAWGDYDNDGDLDVLLTGQTSSGLIAKVYRNDGTDIFADIGASLTAVYDGSVAWGDYDNDGDLDVLLTGRYDSSNNVAKVYRNDGSDTFTDIGASLTSVHYSSVAWGDYDNDGDLDILLTGYTGSAPISKVYRNDGGDTFTDISAPLTHVQSSSVAWGDYDNDGDLDILLTGYDIASQPVAKIYRNDGGGSFTASSIVLTGIAAGSAAWGDYDNDGDLDVLLTGIGSGGPISKVYRNDDSDTFVDIGGSLTDVYWSSTAWGDYDNDGDLDILLTGYTGSINVSRVYRNDGLDTFIDVDTYLTSVRSGSVAWGDYDNDGDLDILLTGHDGSKRIASIYRNNTAASNSVPTAPSGLNAQIGVDSVDLSWSAPPPTSTTPITGLTYNLYVGTAPGQVDVATPMAFTAPVSEGLRLLPAMGNAQHGPTATLTGLAEGAYYWSVQAVDHTFAGSPFAAEGRFYIGPPFTNVISGVLPAMYTNGVAWGDYDNDGDLDILHSGTTSGGDDYTRLYRNDGADTFVDTGVLANVSGPGAWGDYDNDGDLDILLQGVEDSGRVARVYRNDGGGTFVTAVTTDTLLGVYSGSTAWGDYDNDGDLDILMTGQAEGLSRTARVYRNDGADNFVTAVSTDTLTGVSYSSAEWGDYDNDGDLDILMTGFAAPGKIVSAVYRNDGADVFVTAVTTDTLTGVYGNSSSAWGDYDNDGDLDILITGWNGTEEVATVYRNEGSDTFVTAVTTDTLAGVQDGAVAWGDYDNDGDLDMLLTGDTGDTILPTIYRNDGGDVFTAAITDSLPEIYASSVAWGDYDNDGDLDIFFAGNDIDEIPFTALYRNNTLATNTVPAAPGGLSALTAGDTVELSWTAPPPTSTTPITGLTYNLFVCTAPGQVDVMPPMAFTAPVSNGLRLLPAMGNAQHGLSATLVLTDGTYYWSVQAVDHTFAGSPFAGEGQFTILSNQAPIADAGTDQGVDTSALVILDGTGSTDPDGDLPLTYGWTQIGGPSVAFNGALSVTTFTASGDPDVLTFTLTVTDSLGLPSTPDQVVVTVNNQAPVAAAGPDQGVGTNAVVELDGSGSSDPDNDLPLIYGWAQIGGPSVTFNGALSVTTFTAPGDPDVLTFTLTVTDSLGLPSTPDQVVVTVNNQAPVADAGPYQSVGTSAVVELDGSGSSDPDGDLPLTYGWAQIGSPTVTFVNTLSITTFTAPDAAAVLTFTLTVTDSLGLPSLPDQVVVTVSEYSVYLPLVLRNY